MENYGFADHEDFLPRRCSFVNGPIIVGAGPSGLATAACLREQGPYVVLEKAACIASLWQLRTYDRLKLHLPKQFCQLPKLPFPQEFFEYANKHFEISTSHYPLRHSLHEKAESNFERRIVEKRGQIEEHLYRKNGFLYLCTNPKLSRIKEMMCQTESARVDLLQIEKRLCHTEDKGHRLFLLKTEVYYRPWTRKRDPDCDSSNRIIDIITQASTVVIIVVKGEGSGSVENECRDAEKGEGSRSGANQDRDGEGEGSSSGESQGQDRGEGNASGENQGGDRNAEGSGSNDDEDERERQRRVSGDIEQGIQENNQEEIDFAGIPEAFLAIIGATSYAAVDFHSSGVISSTILSLVMAINVFGFLCCMTSMLHRHRKPRAARIFGTIGAAAAGFGLLLLVSVYFSSYYGWMILVLGTLAILVICFWAFFP